MIIAGEIHHISAKRAVEHMRALSEKSDDPINLIISSPGGHVKSGDMLHDMIKFIKPRVRCIGSGWGASAGALIFIGAALKNRYCLPKYAFLAAPTQRRHWGASQ